MTTLLDAVPIWSVAVLIFLLRIVDVGMGTIRTIAVVQGRTGTAVVLGFFEVLVWVAAIAQVVARIDETPWLAPFYAAGFSAGVWVGMVIERRLSLGRFAVRILTSHRASEITSAVRPHGQVLGTFTGQSGDHPVALVFVSAMGRRVPALLDAARAVDPELFYLVETATAWSENLHPTPLAGSWLAAFKRK